MTQINEMPEQAASNKTSKRAYHSPLREQQSAETRENIITAGSELVHHFPDWDWNNLTAKAVGERAGVSERTVRRYFTTESKLRDAVLQRMVEESGIQLGNLEVSNYAEVVASLFHYLQSFTAERTVPIDPAFDALDRARMAILKDAVVRAIPTKSVQQQETVSAMFDIVWQPELYERLTQKWGFDAEQALSGITWLIGLIEQAIQNDQLPETSS